MKLGNINSKKIMATCAFTVFTAFSLAGCSVIPETKAQDNEIELNIASTSNYQELLEATKTPVVEVRPTPSLLIEEKESKFKDFYKYVVVNSNNVNVRLDTNVDSLILGQLKGGTSCKAIAKYEDWVLIDLNGNIGWVLSEYLDVKGDYIANYTHRECLDIVYATSKVYFRSTPTTKENNQVKLFNSDLIPKGAEIEVFAETNNGWILGKYQGKIAYLYRGNTESLAEKIQMVFPEIEEVKIQKVVSLKNDSYLLYNPYQSSKVIKQINMYQTGEVLAEFGDYYFVKTNEGFGYILKTDFRELTNICHVVDESDRTRKIYVNNDIVLADKVGVGKGKWYTPIGVFKIDSKYPKKIMVGVKDRDGWEGEIEVQYVMYLDTSKIGRAGIAEHSSTDPEGDSHGCIREYLVSAKRAYELTPKGTDVNIQYYKPYLKEIERPFWCGYYNSRYSKR